MQKIARFKLPILVLAISAVAVVAGLYIAGFMPGVGTSTALKQRVEPVSFTEPFVVNLADPSEVHYVKLRIAMELEPMTKDDLLLFTSPPEGGHGSSLDAVTGVTRLAKDPTLRDAAIDVISRFTSDELVTPKGKDDLKHALLVRFDEVAQSNRLPPPKGTREGIAHNPAHPPWNVQDVYFEEFAVQ